MAQSNQPTVRQFEDLRQTAIVHGVSREQIQQGSSQFVHLFGALTSGSRIKVLPPIAPPSWGGRVHFIDNVPMRLGQLWGAAIHAGAPQTMGESKAWWVGDQYPPSGSKVTRANVVLLNLKGGTYQQALEWAQLLDLKQATPRHVFGLVHHKPSLIKNLGVVFAYIVSPQECTFQGSARVCGVRFDERGRWAGADEVAGIGSDCGWVAFLRG